MSEYKVGDEVLVKGIITNVTETDKYLVYKVKFISEYANGSFRFLEDVLVPVNKPTELKSPQQAAPHDAVANPSHYQGRFGLEVVDVLRNFTTSEQLKGAFLTNTLEYLLRFQGKNGLEDLKKARKNLDWLIEEYEKEGDSQ